jgi:hypothetical protein
VKTIDEMIAVMERARDGATIQYKEHDSGREWQDITPPAWNWFVSDYRAKPVAKTLDVFIDPAVTLEEAIILSCVDLNTQRTSHRTKKVTLTWEE